MSRTAHCRHRHDTSELRMQPALRPLATTAKSDAERIHSFRTFLPFAIRINTGVKQAEKNSRLSQHAPSFG
jgi:hypothetical protein